MLGCRASAQEADMSLAPVERETGHALRFPGLWAQTLSGRSHVCGDPVGTWEGEGPRCPWRRVFHKQSWEEQSRQRGSADTGSGVLVRLGTGRGTGISER